MNERQLTDALRLAADRITPRVEAPMSLSKHARRRQARNIVASLAAAAVLATGSIAVAHRIAVKRPAPSAQTCDGTLRKLIAVPGDASDVPAIAALGSRGVFANEDPGGFSLDGIDRAGHIEELLKGTQVTGIAVADAAARAWAVGAAIDSPGAGAHPPVTHAVAYAFDGSAWRPVGGDVLRGFATLGRVSAVGGGRSAWATAAGGDGARSAIVHLTRERATAGPALPPGMLSVGAIESVDDSSFYVVDDSNRIRLYQQRTGWGHPFTPPQNEAVALIRRARGALYVLAQSAGGAEGGMRLFRLASKGWTSVALPANQAFVPDMAIGPDGRVWLAGGKPDTSAVASVRSPGAQLPVLLVADPNLSRVAEVPVTRGNDDTGWLEAVAVGRDGAVWAGGAAGSELRGSSGAAVYLRC